LPPINSNPEVSKKVIKHKALVKEITGSSLIVSIMNQSACSSCHANGACTMADVREKEVEIMHYDGVYSCGQEVSVVFRESLGFQALFYGYVLPFIMVLIALIFIFSATGDELLAGLLALGVLVPYYIALYFFRDFLKTIFKFELEESGKL
jgi:positive regulator of sigma E activity